MSGAIRAILLVFAMLFAAEASQAHSPYFTKFEKIALPDGTTGEIRLLHGDGVILSDPVRVMILDAQGRPLARSPWAFAMLLDCDRGHRCRAFNFDRLLIHQPNPAAFRAEPALDLPNEDYSFNETEGHGFTTRLMTPLDLASGYAAYLTQHWIVSAVAVTTSGLGILFILFVNGSAPPTTWRDKAIHYLLFAVLGLAIMPIFMALTLVTLLFAAMPILLWFSLSAFGVLAAVLLFYGLRRLNARPRPA
jgi:hypothetical protein